MKVFYNLTPSEGESAVALGNFDGLHLGHQKVLASALEGKSRGLLPTVLTFAERPGEKAELLLPQDRKIELLAGLGFAQAYILDFDSVKDMTARAFVDDVLAGVCKAREACCGFNFTFGRGGRAGSADLVRLCAARGMETRVAQAVLYGGTPVSSTRIRGLIANGRVAEAARLLGRPFGYESPVLPGRKLGRRLGTPTVNQAVPEGYARPKFGVYVSAVRVGEKLYCGVTNVGVKPTVGSERALVETWMPRYAGGDLYGRTLRTDLLRFLRPERRFPDLEELRAEILRNGEQAQEYFRKNIPHSGGL